MSFRQRRFLFLKIFMEVVIIIVNLNLLIGNLSNAPTTDFSVKSLLSTLAHAETFNDIDGHILFDQDVLEKLYWGEPIVYPSLEKLEKDIKQLPAIVDSNSFI